MTTTLIVAQCPWCDWSARHPFDIDSVNRTESDVLLIRVRAALLHHIDRAHVDLFITAVSQPNA